MVTINRRLAVLKPLLQVRIGRGALRLPSLPEPQLFRLELRYPKNRWVKPATPVTKGAHGFSKAVLPGLKYHNPALEIDVQTFPKSASLLTLHFQCQDPEKLRNIASPGKRFSDASSPESEQPAATPDFHDRTAPRPTAAHDEVTIRQLPSGSDLPQPLYQRSVTLSLRSRPMWDIIQWFKFRTGCEDIPISPEDELLAEQFAEAEVQRGEARARSKIQQEAIDRDKAVLEQAKRIAEQNATEAAAVAAV